MKTVPGALQAILNGQSMRLALLLEITRRDGTIFRFTDHDEPVTVGTDTYQPGLVISDQAQKNSLSPANQSSELLIDDTTITRPDLESGAFDGAQMQVYLVAWDNPAAGTVQGLRGTIGETTITDTGAMGEVRGLSDRLRQNIADTFTTTCPYDLGDVQELGVAPVVSRCKVDLTTFTVSSEVTTVVGSNNNQFDANGLSGFASKHFQYGVFKWSDGPNANRTNQVKDHTQETGTGRITLAFPEPFPIDAGHKFEIAAGCKKDLVTCRDKFNNVVNHGGFPFIPGQNTILKTGGQ